MTTYWEDPALFDRLDELRRDQDAVAALWPGAALLRVGAGGTFPVTGPPEAPVLAVEPTTGTYDPQLHWLLGRAAGRVLFFRADAEADGSTVREVGVRLSPVELGLATMAVATAQWHGLEPSCPQCGGPSSVAAAGTARFCPQCRRDLFPRTDPAVIVAVIDRQDRLLLAHQGSWPVGRCSVLAGFVEAGESLEQAVHREVFEEAGLRLTDVTYVASQPWPFPRSIMLGFRATAITASIAVDGEEIVEARWFSRDELRAAVADGSVDLPGRASIAYRLISGWLSQA